MEEDLNHNGRLFLYQISILVMAGVLQFGGILDIYGYLPVSLLIRPGIYGFSFIATMITVGFLYEERINESIESSSLTRRYDAVLIIMIILYLISGLLLVWALHDILTLRQRINYAETKNMNRVRKERDARISLEGVEDEDQKMLLRAKYREMERREKVYSLIPTLAWLILTVPGIPYLGGIQLDATLIFLLPVVISLIPLAPGILKSMPGAKIKRVKMLEGFVGMKGKVKGLKHDGKVNSFYVRVDHSRLVAVSRDPLQRGDTVMVQSAQYIPRDRQMKEPFVIVSLVQEPNKDHS
ncbi:MAG: hypothetical protein ACP5NK_03495 [Thermoplasmata archaeon]